MMLLQTMCLTEVKNSLTGSSRVGTSLPSHTLDVFHSFGIPPLPVESSISNLVGIHLYLSLCVHAII